MIWLTAAMPLSLPRSWMSARTDAHDLMAGVAHDVGDVEGDHRLVLDHQHAHRCHPLQLAARFLEAALGSIGVDAENARGVGNREALEHGQQ
jgi:hypothetical protein